MIIPHAVAVVDRSSGAGGLDEADRNAPYGR